MRTFVSEQLGEWVTLVIYAIGSVGFSIAGILVELAAIENMTSNQLTVGLWEAGFGALLLVVGLYLFGYQKLWCQLQAMRMNTDGS